MTDRHQHIKISTVAWGSYEGLANRYLIPSLKFSLDRLTEDGHTVNFELFSNFKGMFDSWAKNINYCHFYFAPDNLIAKNSLYNLFTIGRHKRHCIAVPHFRVAPSFSCDFPIDEPELASLALEHIHNTFAQSNDYLEYNQCHLGFSQRRITDKITTVVHNMPTVFLINPTSSDISFFKKTNYDVSEWDRGWLKKLIRENRLKVIGSSDLACIVEVTENTLNDGMLRRNSFDDRRFDQHHNDSCNMFVYALRQA